jgi:transcriptional regulator with XRE-family HTH domain
MGSVQFDLKRWMAANRYSVRKLGDALDVSPSTVQQWRNAGRVPKMVTLALPQLEGPTEEGE